MSLGQDFISYLDDNDVKRDSWVDIISINSFVTFKLGSGKIIVLPPHRILKIKKGDGDSK